MIVVLGRVIACTLRKNWVMQGYICTWLDASVRGISGRNFVKGGGGENVKPRKNPDFLGKVKL